MKPPPTSNDPTAPTVMLTREDLSSRWKVSIPTIKRWEKKHANYPKPTRIGPRMIRYRETDVIAYEAQRQTP